jgi:hypothetical protein
VKRKIAALVITAEPKGKKLKVLTHWPRFIEPVVIPEFGKRATSAAGTKEIVPPAQSIEEPAVIRCYLQPS